MTSIFFVVNSRRMSQADFDLLVSLTEVEILEICHNRLKAMEKNPNISFENVEYDDELYYNYQLSKYGTEICTDPEKIKQIAEDKWRDYLKREWEFVF